MGAWPYFPLPWPLPPALPFPWPWDPLVGGAGFDAALPVFDGLPGLFGFGEPGQPARAYLIEAPAQLLERRRLLLERGEPVQYVVRVDFLNGRQVLGARRPQLHPLTENTRAPRDRGCA